MFRFFLSLTILLSSLSSGHAVNMGTDSTILEKERELKRLTNQVIKSIEIRNFYITKRKLDKLIPLVHDHVQLHFKYLKHLDKDHPEYLDHHDRVHERHDMFNKLKYLKEVSEASVRVNGDHIKRLVIELVHSRIEFNVYDVFSSQESESN